MNENHRQEADIPVWARLAHTAARVEARLEHALADSGLSLAKFAVLDQLVKAGEPLLLTRLAERLSCCKSNITSLIDRLEADGLVRRVDAPEDRRSVLAAVTAEGQRRYELGSRTLAAAEQELLKSFEEGEMDLLKSLLNRFN